MKAQKLQGMEERISHPIASIFVLATLLLSAPLVHAAPVTIGISGEITSLGGYTEAIPDTIYDGVTFTGTYTYNSSTLDSDSDPNWGVYEHDAPYGMSIVVGGYEFKTASNHTDQFEMQIINDDPTNGLHDYYIVFSHENISVPSVDFEISGISWNLWDSTYDAISSDDLPLTNPNLEDWDYNSFRISGAYGPDHHGLTIYGTVTQAVLVPEPFTVTLMVIGIFFSRRRR